jgi:cellulose biosynthesis protein BcsQ
MRLKDLSQLLNTIKNVKNSFNPDLNIEGYLMTMFDSRLRLSQQVEAELNKFFGEKVFKNKIFRNVKIGEAPSYGKAGFNIRPDFNRLYELYGFRKRVIGKKWNGIGDKCTGISAPVLSYKL